MHDYSRDIMLATAQEHIETRMLLAAAENKSKEMEESLKIYFYEDISPPYLEKHCRRQGSWILL